MPLPDDFDPLSVITPATESIVIDPAPVTSLDSISVENLDNTIKLPAKEPIIPVKTVKEIPKPKDKNKDKDTKEHKKEETPLEHVQSVIKEYGGQISNIPYSHPTFWIAKNQL